MATKEPNLLDELDAIQRREAALSSVGETAKIVEDELFVPDRHKGLLDAAYPLDSVILAHRWTVHPHVEVIVWARRLTHELWRQISEARRYMAMLRTVTAEGLREALDSCVQAEDKVSSGGELELVVQRRDDQRDRGIARLPWDSCA